VRNTHRILVTKLGGINPLGRPRHRWKDDKEILKKISNRVEAGFIRLKIGTWHAVANVILNHILQ
jgi:hypothetical protein